MSYLLAVYLFDRRVGDLALVEGRLQFSYSADWLQHADTVPLSRSLPLQVEPFNDLQARPFFAGLLPEGKLRQLIARQFQVSKQNDFALPVVASRLQTSTDHQFAENPVVEHIVQLIEQRAALTVRRLAGDD